MEVGNLKYVWRCTKCEHISLYVKGERPICIECDNNVIMPITYPDNWEELVEHAFSMTTEELYRDLLLLECLKEHGVDNWEGYDHATNLFQERV
jgi:hypothetical protein